MSKYMYDINDIVEDIYNHEGYKIKFENIGVIKKIKFLNLYSEKFKKPASEIYLERERVINEIKVRLDMFIRDSTGETIH